MSEQTALPTVPQAIPQAPPSADAQAAPQERTYLSRIKVESFGAFSSKVVGPLAPGLNVMYGRNEAGKTTLASFVGGVLFGWEEARGGRNTYRPQNAERAGSLFFSRGSQDFELTRARNADGLQGDASLVDDIDKETFRTMFSLTSDELRSLRNTTDVTAKLLTAGSGTGASPAHALAEVQQRLAECTSRAAGAERSLVNLAAEQEELQERMAQAAEEAERLKRKDKEFHDLAPQRADLARRIEELNSVIEGLTACRTSVEKLDAQIAEQTQELEQLAEDEAALRAARAQMQPVEDELLQMSAAEEREVRDRIEALADEQVSAVHRTAAAKENHVASKAAYEALLETSDLQEQETRSRRQRGVQIALSVALPVSFMVVGVLVFMHGRVISSLSFTALGMALVLFALFLAAGALVMLFRPSKTEEELAARKQDLQWVMLQDKKKYESCVAEQAQLEERIEAYLAGAGLSHAEGSLRRARVLLDEAREARSEESLLSQRHQALALRRSSLEAGLKAAKAQKDALFERVKLRDGADLAAIDAAIARKVKQRAGLLEASEKVNLRYGELSQELSQAEHLRRFDELKLRSQQVRTRQNESAQEYARLLLAKRMLEAAIAAWESKSQPEVYRQASRLLSLMTGGRWTKVSMMPEGRLQVTDSVKTTRPPAHLSLSTCQQLYLSLRIALLVTADNVGRAVPVLADDILVNFDETRRAAAARALAELAEHRQVLLFTCHKEIVDVCARACPSVNVVEL